MFTILFLPFFFYHYNRKSDAVCVAPPVHSSSLAHPRTLNPRTKPTKAPTIRIINDFSSKNPTIFPTIPDIPPVTHVHAFSTSTWIAPEANIIITNNAISTRIIQKAFRLVFFMLINLLYLI